MTDWKKVTGTQPDKPEEVDRTSSPSTVYLRKNIEQVTREVEGSDGKMQTVTEWQYDEKEMTVKEYENMALMKSVVEENTSGIVESVTQFLFALSQYHHVVHISHVMLCMEFLLDVMVECFQVKIAEPL